jgi:hypothetical protein
MLLAAALASVAAAAPVPATCHEPAPCVYVTPDPVTVRAPGTVYTYRGRGWPANAQVQASYGSYCSPRFEVCAGVGAGKSFRADAKGRFIFRLVYGRHVPRSVPGPAGAGGEQESIRFASDALPVRDDEEPREIDAQTPPPPSTPEQRAEAAALVEVARRGAERLYRGNEPLPGGTMDYDKQIEVCRPDWEPFKDNTPRGRVIRVLLDTTLDRSMIVPILPRLHPFADELERMPLADPVLRRGADAWIWEIRRPRYWPKPTLCAVIRKWKATGYDLKRAPVDPKTVGPISAFDSPKEIWQAANRLRELGVGPDGADLFGGLIDANALVLDDEI